MRSTSYSHTHCLNEENNKNNDGYDDIDIGSNRRECKEGGQSFVCGTFFIIWRKREKAGWVAVDGELLWFTVDYLGPQ